LEKEVSFERVSEHLQWVSDVVFSDSFGPRYDVCEMDLSLIDGEWFVKGVIDTTPCEVSKNLIIDVFNDYFESIGRFEVLTEKTTGKKEFWKIAG
jgi:hypothetical protein